MDDRLQTRLQLSVAIRRPRACEALALYSVITYMDTVGGIFYPAGGLHAVPAALATAAVKGGPSCA